MGVDAFTVVAIVKQSSEWNEHAALRRERELLVGRSKELRGYHTIAARCKPRELGF